MQSECEDQPHANTDHFKCTQASEERSRAGGDLERQSMLADKLSFHTEAAKAVMMANMQVLPHPDIYFTDILTPLH
jgi:hypothetical protein